MLARLPALLLAALALPVAIAETTGPAPALSVPAAWTRAAPGPREAAHIEQGAARHGWPAMATALRAAALDTYARGDVANAEAWAAAARWAALWGATEREEAARWREAMLAEGWPAARETFAAPAASPAGDSALAERLTPALRARLLADPAWSLEFFALEHPLDRRAESLAVLARLHARDPKAFDEFGALALAIALVHDTPPPAHWPHWQVPPDVFPRRLAPDEEVFDHLVALSREGRALWRADRLEAAELRFVVDLALPAEERAWALARVRAPLPRLADVYSSVNYRQDRIEADAYVWPGPSYRLEDILREGGICVDQAYFATQAGKARGAPTLLFAGAGRDGRHAWFGYLGPGRRWMLDAGRHASQNYVTGVAYDPQTWTEISDHELKFLSKGFRRERNAREAAAHAAFARWLRETGRVREAEAAARTATRLERRTLAAWEELLALRPDAGEAREAVAREAAQGLTSYPDLHAHFLGMVIESLRTRGQTAEADRLGRELARRFAGKRGDLSTREISGQLARAMASETIEEQMRLYRSLMRQFGRGAGAAMWDEVARPFVASLATAGRWREARSALALARETLGGGFGSQIDTEMRALDAELAQKERAAGGR
jgi:hypothetical protein